MSKKYIAICLSVVLLAVSSVFLGARPQISREKEAEIRRMLELTGMQKLTDQMKSQMIGALRAQIKEVPEQFWNRFEKNLDTKELIEKIIPLYDKYYSVEDIRAVNAFYSSDVGRR